MDQLPQREGLVEEVWIKSEPIDDCESTTHCHIKCEAVEIGLVKKDPFKEEPLFIKTEIEVDDEESTETNNTPSQLGMRFPQSEHVKPHQGKDTGYKCVVCSKSFSRKETYVNHELWHTGESPHKCTTCGKSYTRRILLEGHLKKHLPEADRPVETKCETQRQQFKCVQCPKNYSRKQYLQDHVSYAHSQESRYNCEHCDKKYTRKDHLICHTRIHSGEAPYKCERCPKTFLLKQSQKEHMAKRCNKPKLFACYICSKPMPTQSALTNHINRSHTKEGSFKCPICSKTFIVEPNLIFHMKTHKKNSLLNC